MDAPNDDEVSACPECDGQGGYEQWKAVAGHYEGGEVFRLQCDHCDGAGKLADGTATIECQLPPLGWRCTRGDGHEGPCAAVECPEELAMVERAMQRLRSA